MTLNYGINKKNETNGHKYKQWGMIMWRMTDIERYIQGEHFIVVIKSI